MTDASSTERGALCNGICIAEEKTITHKLPGAQSSLPGA